MCLADGAAVRRQWLGADSSEGGEEEGGGLYLSEIQIIRKEFHFTLDKEVKKKHWRLSETPFLHECILYNCKCNACIKGIMQIFLNGVL